MIACVSLLFHIAVLYPTFLCVYVCVCVCVCVFVCVCLPLFLVELLIINYYLVETLVSLINCGK